jgi:hypothetical protein
MKPIDAGEIPETGATINLASGSASTTVSAAAAAAAVVAAATEQKVASVQAVKAEQQMAQPMHGSAQNSSDASTPSAVSAVPVAVMASSTNLASASASASASAAAAAAAAATTAATSADSFAPGIGSGSGPPPAVVAASFGNGAADPHRDPAGFVLSQILSNPMQPAPTVTPNATVVGGMQALANFGSPAVARDAEMRLSQHGFGTGSSVALSQQGQQTQQLQQPQQPQQPQQGGGWSCPTHGPANVAPGYQGRGFECKVTSVGQVPPWGWRPGKDKNTGYPLQYTFCNRDGQYVYACKERSA